MEANLKKGMGGICLELDVQSQVGGRIFDVDGQRGGGLENWTIFMDTICVSSLDIHRKIPVLASFLVKLQT